MRTPVITGRQVAWPMLGPVPPDFKARTFSHYTGYELVPDAVTNTHIQMLDFSIGQGKCKHSTAAPRSFGLQAGGVFRIIRDSGPPKGISVA
jgi:hypothetical protein